MSIETLVNQKPSCIVTDPAPQIRPRLLALYKFFIVIVIVIVIMRDEILTLESFFFHKLMWRLNRSGQPRTPQGLWSTAPPVFRA